MYIWGMTRESSADRRSRQSWHCSSGPPAFEHAPLANPEDEGLQFSHNAIPFMTYMYPNVIGPSSQICGSKKQTVSQGYSSTDSPIPFMTTGTCTP